MMKRNIFLLLFTLFTIGLAAQKAERKAIRSGNDSYREQLYGNAEEKYKHAMEVNAGSKEASFNLANTYYKQQRWDDALKEYQHYLTLEQTDAAKISMAWANVGNAYLKKKGAEKGQDQQQGQKGTDNLQMTMEAYKRSLRMNPSDDEVRYNLAVVQKMIQDQGDGGGNDKDKDQDKKDEKKDDKQDKQDKQDQKQDQQKQDQQQDQKEGQMSQDNVEQILKALEQEERETQERVKQMQSEQRKRQNMHNRQQDKDW